MCELIEFVITVPESFGAELSYKTRARTTLGVLTQLIAGAQQNIVLATPFIHAERSLIEGPLAEALQAALQRGVRIDIVSTGQSLQSLRKVEWLGPPHQNVRFFQAKANIDREQRLGSHAKFCIADKTEAYVGSANLTGPGLAENLEMGFLVHGKHAKQIADFWELLVNKGFWVDTNGKTLGHCVTIR